LRDGSLSPGRAGLCLAVALLLAPALGGCSMSFPMASLVNEPEVTAALGPSTSPMAPLVSVDDWALAAPALVKALEPAATGATRWESKASGIIGSFEPAGSAYVRNDQVCRAFLATVTLQGNSTRHLGAACRPAGAEWVVQKVRPLPA